MVVSGYRMVESGVNGIDSSDGDGAKQTTQPVNTVTTMRAFSKIPEFIGVTMR